jgi:Cu(I)/Ag(I) efflux system membrane fusion protein
LPGESFIGKVVRIAPTFDPGTRTLEAEVQLDNPGGRLRPGMYGYGSIRLELHRAATVLPSSAVQISGTEKYVFVLEQDHVARRSVETGVDAGPWIEITRGVSTGQDVVTAGSDGLSDGAKVRVTRDVSPYTGLAATLERPAAQPAAGSR